MRKLLPALFNVVALKYRYQWIAWIFILCPVLVSAQTSWKGTISNEWSVSANWTAGVPNASTDAVIGDANFTGPFSPAIDVRARCRSLVMTSGTLTVNRSLTIYGNLLINSGATISHGKTVLSVKGNWTNTGTYTTTNTAATVRMSGTLQTVIGTTTFAGLTIGAGSTTTINTNTIINTALSVSGTLIPAENATPIVISGTAATTVNPGGELQVKAAVFTGNYTLTGAFTMVAGSAVNYNATLVNQTITNTLTYATLRVSGTGTKTLAGNLNPLVSTTANTGNIEVLAATLDLSSFTANRGTTVAGGTVYVANGALLKVGGTNTFPANFTNTILPLNSTVEYSGTNQIVGQVNYGNLSLSAGSGTAAKTFPATLTVYGSLTLNQGSGTAVSATVAGNTQVFGNVVINTGTTLNGGSATFTTNGNITNAGTLTGATGTVVMLGDGTAISGVGTYNFNNLTIQGAGITAAATSNITVAGNLASNQPGSFLHASGGSITLSGTAKTVTGAGFNFANLTITGTVSIPTNINVSGNLGVSGTLTGTGGSLDMTGAAKAIAGGGTLNFGTLIIDGSVTTANNFSIATALNVNGSFSATAGTATFGTSSVLSGTANLFNIAGTGLQLTGNANLGVAGTFTVTAAGFNTTTTSPNTVTFNGTAAQSIGAYTFSNLVIAGSNTKTLTGAVTVNGDLTITSTLSAGAQTLSLLGNWANSGTFTAATSTVVLSGAGNTTITGATTFNILTLNKTSNNNLVTLLANTGVATVNMNTGAMTTSVNTLTISNTRTGNGIILGNITRTNSFLLGSSYAFESPNTTLTLTGLFLGTSITLSTFPGRVADFASGASINREFSISMAGISLSLAATLRLHYEDAILNGNTKSTLELYRNTGSGWTNLGANTGNTTANYIEISGLLTAGTGRYTMASPLNVVRWNGAVSSDWNTAANWTTTTGAPGRPPGANDIAEIGTAVFTNQPTINSAVTIKGIYFGSTQAATLTLGSGSLTTQGNIAGTWSTNATHTINVNNQNLTVNGLLALGDGTSGHDILMNIGTGTVSVLGDVIQGGSSAVTFTGAGQLNVGGNYTYNGGTFTAGTGTVQYNGTGTSQAVAGLNYNQLAVNSAGIAQIGSATTATGNLTLNAGTLAINAATTISGNVQVNGGNITANNSTITVGGNWSGSNFFTPGGSTVIFSGGNTQTIGVSAFNNLTINKTAGSATLSGNATINGSLAVSGGTFNLSAFTASRSATGGTFSLAANASLVVGGATNFPANYAAYTLDNVSTVNYNGAIAQNVYGPLNYGFLTLSAGTNTLTGNTVVNGDLTIGNGATLALSTFNCDVYGNWNSAGALTAGTGSVTLRGTGKTVSGNTTFNRLSVFGSYVVNGGNTTYNGPLQILTGATYDNGNGTTTIGADLYNNGAYTTSGTLNFNNTTSQTLRFNNAINYNAASTINFNGTVAPVLLFGATPTWSTLNINNTGGINPGIGWNVQGALNIASGAVFNGGPLIHQFSNAVNNSGTINSSGTLQFTPSAAQTVQLAGLNASGTVLLGGTGALALSGTPTLLTNVVVSNPNGVTPAAGLTIAGSLLVYAGSSFTAGSNSYTIGGNLESNGTFNGGTSNVTMTAGSGYIAGGDSTIFYNLTFGGNIVAVADFCVSNNLTINGSLDASLGIAVMTGANNGTIGGTASPYAIAQLEISKTNGTTALLGRTTTRVTNLDILSGILDTSDSTVVQDATLAGAMVIKNNARLIIRGSKSLPVFNRYRLDTLSNVEYAGGVQAVAAVTPYGNLIISAAGNKTAAGALHILHDFTLSNGNFLQGGVVDTLEGAWNMTGGTYTNTGATVLFYGQTDQQVSTIANFNNITVKKTGGQVVLNTNATVDGVLNFTAGSIRTGANRAIVSATGTVTNAAQATGWVYGFLQKFVGAGAGVSMLFEVGDSLRFAPVTALFASVGTAGNITASTNGIAHPQLATSGLNTSRKVNRYWTLTNGGLVYTTVTLTFNWVGTDVDAGATPANFKVAEYTGGTWSLPAVLAPQTLSIQATGLTTLGDFAVGELAAIFIWTGAVSTDWFTNGNWSTSTVPTILSNATIPTGLTNYPNIILGTALINNLLVQPGASVTINGGSMQIAGLITNTGTMNAQNGSLIYSGSAAQVINAATFVNNTVLNLTSTNTTTLTIGGTLNIGGILKVTGGQLVSGNFVTLLSTATRTALIDGSGTGQVTGNVTVQRYVPSSYGYRYVSSPFQSATVSQFAEEVNLAASFPSFYKYDETKVSSGWTNYTTATNPLVPLQGYAAQLGTATTPLTMSATGVVNNQVVTAPALTNTNQPYTLGFNLIGNPYPSPVDWDLAAGWSRTNIDNAVYYFNPGGADQYTGTYSSYINGVSSDGVATNVIAAMQGFFIHVSNGTFPVTGGLSVNNAARINNLAPNFHRVQQTGSIIRLATSFADDGLAADPLVIYFDDAAAGTFEKEMDALKLINTDNTVPSWYAWSDDHQKLSIGAWPTSVDSNTVIPLGLQIERTGFVTFSTLTMQRIPAGINIFLKDAQTGQYQQLQENAKYRVYLESGKYDQRFSLVFKRPASGGNDTDESNFRAFSKGKTLYGFFERVPGDKCRITVSNVSGQVLLQRDFTGSGTQTLGSQYASGLYLVSFYTEGKKVTLKVFISN